MAKKATKPNGRYPIERGVPMPAQLHKAGNFPFDEMAVGDSFLVPPDERGAVQRAAHHRKKVHGEVFTVRKLPDGACRCWRVE